MRASCRLFARRWIRPVPLAVGLLLVAAAFSATAVAQFVAPALAGLGSAGKWVLRPVEGGLQQALLDNLRSIGAAGRRKVGGRRRRTTRRVLPDAQPGRALRALPGWRR